MYSFYNFKSRGIGIITNTSIKKDTYVGIYFSKNQQISSDSRLIYNGWIETNPLGRFLNHNSNCNLYFVKKEYDIELYTKVDININTELTVDYTQIVKLINLPDSLILAYEIFNYEYIEEVITINKNII